MDAEHLAIHTAFDALAWVGAAGLGYALKTYAPIAFPVAPAQRLGYYAVLFASSGVGAFLFGTLNMIACGRPELARSVEGAIFGGVLGVEIYKYFAGVTARTGARFAAPLALGVVIGRFGCFFSGIDDFTYGTPTNLPWAHDFGDGVLRHPAPLYESAAMAVFLVLYLIAVLRDRRWILDNGLYLAVLWYALQRFVWEFFKPYAPVLGPLTVFQLLSVALAIYALAMLATSGAHAHERAVTA
jgi:phosphatidylglycerol:prolipoprotein diacylglycerol transferase